MSWALIYHCGWKQLRAHAADRQHQQLDRAIEAGLICRLVQRLGRCLLRRHKAHRYHFRRKLWGGNHQNNMK
jgi:hypothetical protein